MNPRDLKVFLGLELFAVAWAGAVFSVLESKFLAGSLAGGYFVLSGLFILWRVLKWPERARAFTFYMVLIHVFLVSLPMIGIRMMNAGQDFSEIRFFGMPGPVFHRLSTVVFSLLILATILDLMRAKRRAVNRA